MSFCKNCGAKLEDNMAHCPNCGTPTNETSSPANVQQNIPNGQGYNSPQQNIPNGQSYNNGPQNNTPYVVINSAPLDSGSFGYSILGFCIPLVGLILFLVWRDQKPRSSKAAGMGALVSVCCYIAFYVIIAMVGVASTMS